MKQLLHLKSLLIALLVLFCGGSVYAQETKTLKFSVNSISSVSCTSGTMPEGVTVSYRSTYTDKFQLTKDNSMTLTLSDFPFTVSSVTLDLKTNKKSGQGNLTVKHNNKQIHKTNSLTTDPVSYSDTYKEYTFSAEDTETSGDLVITLAATANSIYCDAFTITYVDNTSATGTLDPENSFTNATENATVGVPYTVQEITTLSTGRKSYASSDETVATIDGSGKVTLKKAGETTITVTTAADDNYKEGSASYKLIVEKGTPVLSFAQETVTVYLGTPQNGPTLTNPSGIAVIYNISNPNIATIQSNGYIQPKAAGTATVTVTPADPDAWEATASYTLKVEEAFHVDAAGTYELVTDATTLKAGNQILISYVYYGEGRLIGRVLGNKDNNNFKGTLLNNGVISEDKSTFEITTESPVTAAVLEVVPDNNGNKWYFHTNEGYLCATSSSNNYLGAKTLDKAGNDAKATINIADNGNATVVFQGNNSRNNLRYNSDKNALLFSCYASTSNTLLPQLYRKIILPKVPISFAESVVEITYGDNYNKQAATTEAASSDLVYTSSDESIVKFHGNNVIDILGPGTVTITATVPATETTSVSSATYTLKVYAPADASEALNEDFSKCDGTNISFGGSSGFKDVPDNLGWTTTNCEAGPGYLKLGTSGSAGSATSPAFSVAGEAPLSFDLAPWVANDDTENAKVYVTLTNATFANGESTMTLSTGNLTQKKFTTFDQYMIKGNSNAVTITFSGEGSYDRFFLDNVIVGGGAHEINLTFSSAGYLTWVATANIDFEGTKGVTAYKITEATPKKITMVEVDKVPEGAAVMLKGSDTKTLKRTTEEVADLSDNKMRACTDASVTGITGSATSTDIYVLGNGNKGLGFYMLSGTLQAGKGYLNISVGAGAKPSFITFEETTGISNAAVETTEDDGTCYNLQGVRVMNPQKGIYINNGKKIVIK